MTEADLVLLSRGFFRTLLEVGGPVLVVAVIVGVTKGTPVTAGTTGGWCYKPTTGEFWADTASGAGEAGF